MDYLESQVAQNNSAPYPEVEQNPKNVPGKPVAYSNRLLSINNGLHGKPVAHNLGLLSVIVACYFGLLGFPGRSKL